MPDLKTKIIRVPLDDAGYAFRFRVMHKGREVAHYDGNQLDPKGMSIGAAERAATAKIKELMEAKPCPT